jgi:Winged helix DNA-binding domain
MSMTSQNIARRRLLNQGILGGDFSKPEDIVRWMGCVQAQDFAQAKWAIGRRGKDITEPMIDKAFNEGRILRTHILRPTWHFVLPEDIGWMLSLTAPKIKAFSKSLYRKLGIDEELLKRSKKIFSRALTGGNQMTREELMALLRKGRINTDDIRSNFFLMDAELDGLICSGPRRGRQFTYVLLRERVPELLTLGQEAAIAGLTTRYFRSRGPATLQDFCWWSGFSLSQAKRGLEMIKDKLTFEVVNGQAYWFYVDKTAHMPVRNSVILLPAFDEFTVAYKDRSDVLDPAHNKRSGNGLKPVIVINGRIAGTWRRVIQKEKVLVETSPFGVPDKVTFEKMRKEAKRVALFMQ